MRINATPAGFSAYGQALMARQSRPLTAAPDSVRFGICPVCATAGTAAVVGLVTLGIKVLTGKPAGEKPTCTAQAGTSSPPPPVEGSSPTPQK